MAIFRQFRALIEALGAVAHSLQGVTAALEADLEAQQELGPAVDRLVGLELSRAKFEAEMSALVLKAEGKFKAAANAEARERQLKKSYERLADEIDAEGGITEDSAGGSVPGLDAAAGEAERLHALHLDVAPLDSKALALNHKFGRG